MKRLLLLLPAILVACGSQLVEFPEDTAGPPSEDPAPSPTFDNTYPPAPELPLDPPCYCSDPPVEVCTNGVDDDGDGLVDCADPDCDGNQACPPVEDAGEPEEDAGEPEEDAGDPDAGQPDAGQPDAGDVCTSESPKTCEDELHCCMNACKPLVKGCSQHTRNEHVSCVQNCANAHKVCVKRRSCSKHRD